MINRSKSFWVYFIQFAIFMALPKPGGALSQLLLVVYIVFAVILYLFAFGANGELRRAWSEMRLPYFMAFAVALSFSVSVYLNERNVELGSFFAVLRPVLFFLVFALASMLTARVLRDSCAPRKLVFYMSCFFVIAQAPFLLGNALNSDVLPGLYNADKAKSISEGLRVVGTLANPNFFGFVSAVLALFVFSRSGNSLFEWVVFLFLSFFVLVSGSKSAFLIFFFGIFFVALIRKSTSYILKVLLAIVVLSCVAALLYFFYENRDSFRYLSGLLAVFEGGGVEGIKSIGDRLVIWEEAQALYGRRQGVGVLLFGLGPIDSLASLDNEYLYSFYRWGAVGCVLLYSFWASMVFVAQPSSEGKKLAVILVVAMAVIGLQAETFSSLIYGLVVLHLIPMIAKVSENE